MSWVAKRLALLAFGILLALAILAGIEGGLALLEAGEGPRSQDPFAGFSNLVPMFERVEREDGTAVFRTAAARSVPVPAEFAARKPPGGFRVFVVGGSSSAGTPYDYRYAFSGWLARRLEAALPGLEIEVVNAAIDAYASRRIVAVCREIVRHEPDLLIVYAGHNELAESRYYAHLTNLHPGLFRLWTGIAGTRIYAVLADLPLMRAAAEGLRADPIEFGDQKNVLEYFSESGQRLDGERDSERELTYRELHYRYNLEQIIETMRAAGARVMLVTLSQDFVDWPPGASSHRVGLGDAQHEAWNALFGEGNRLSREGDCASALESYGRALAIDAEFALLHFRIAACQRKLSRAEEAYRHYRLASNLDRVPHGAPTRYNEILRDLAERHDTLLVDIESVLTQESPGGLVGEAWFTDLVHPNLRGHQRIAREITDTLRAASLPLPADRWQVDAYREPDLDSLYAAEPQLRLRERTIRGAACALARQRACALTNARAVLAVEPGNEAARKVEELALKIPESKVRSDLLR